VSVAAPELVAPAYWWVPDHVGTAGGEVADLAAACGFAPDPEQRLFLDALFAEAEPASSFTAGRWAALEAAIICPRQNAKTAALEMAVLGDLFLLGAELVVWTAHRFQTATEAFLDFKRLIDSNAILSRRVKRITEASIKATGDVKGPAEESRDYLKEIMETAKRLDATVKALKPGVA
jgi:hypothetical protein